MRKFKLVLILLLNLSLYLSGCASSNEEEKPVIPAFQNKVSGYQVNKMRLTVLKDTARSVGAQAALFWASDQFNDMLNSQTKVLAMVFNFQAMMLDNNVIPPVLEESSNILNLDDESSIRIADKVYKILTPAHFVTTVPSWRDYLGMHFSKPEIPDYSLLPKDNNERDLWNRYVLIGWNEGLDQAQAIFAINLNRLKQDYRGMILYRKLLAQNMVTPPYISKADLGVTGGGDNLRVNDRVLRITALSKLKADSDVWQARVYKPAKALVKKYPPTVNLPKTKKSK